MKAMLELGVIEESHSAWSSPIMLVGKPDGSSSFCVDYRKVNDVFDGYPMPRVDELLDRLGTARFFSTLDLIKGYWQIPLSPESKEKNSFLRAGWFIPIPDSSFRIIRGSSYVPEPYGPSAAPACCICCSLFG